MVRRQRSRANWSSIDRRLRRKRNLRLVQGGLLAFVGIVVAFFFAANWEHNRWEDGTHGLRPTPTPEIIVVEVTGTPSPVTPTTVVLPTEVVKQPTPWPQPTPEIIYVEVEVIKYCWSTKVTASIADTYSTAISVVCEKP